MKPTQFTFIIIAAVVVIAGVVFAMNNQRKSDSGNHNQVGTAGTYCGSNGDLVETMPIQSHRSYCVTTETTELNSNVPTNISFQIIDDQGATLKDYDSVHEKLMHAILVRQDLTNFQHLHPDFDQASGRFTLSDVSVAEAGPYRLFADFTPTSSQMGPDGVKLPVVDRTDLTVQPDGGVSTAESFTPNMTDTAGNYSVSLKTVPEALQAGQATTLNFTMTENGKVVTDLEKYLGELGHTVVLKATDLTYLHTHPMDQAVAKQNGTTNFEVTLPEAGTYKAFMQFQHKGKVRTVEFVLSEVTAASETELPPINNEDGKMMGH